MEESIIRKLYIEYLQEAFDVDQINPQSVSYITQINKEQYAFINPQKDIRITFQESFNFVDGYARIKNNGKYNFINEEGILLTEDWFDDATDFKNGYALVTRGEVNNFIDTKGNFLLKEWSKLTVSCSEFFPNGIATIKPEGKNYYVIDSNGKKIFNNDFNIIFHFIGKNSVALKNNDNPLRSKSFLSKNYEYHIIDCEGNDLKTDYIYLRQLSENVFVASDNSSTKFLVDTHGTKIGTNTFESVPHEKFENGYLIVYRYGKYNLIKENGEFLYQKWYQDISYPHNGICKIRENDKYNYIDQEEKLLSPNWFDYANDFSDDCGIVVINNKYYTIDLNGKLSESCYDYIYEFHNGYAVVKNNNKYNTIDKEGNLISDKWYNYSSQNLQDDMLRLVQNDQGLYNYIGLDDQPILDNWKPCLTKISNGMFGSYENNKLNIFDTTGKFIVTLSDIKTPEYNIGNLIVVDGSPKTNKVLYQNKFFQYTYETETKKYFLRYKPLVDYGKIIICEKANEYIVFQKSTNNTYPLGEKNNITLESNYIIIGDKKYFISGNDFIDITDISFKKKIEKKAGIDKILTLEEFKEICSQPEYEERIQQEKDLLKSARESELKQQLAEETARIQQEEKELLNTKKENLRKSLTNLSEVLAECSKYISEIQSQINNNNYQKVIVPEELLLISVDDHLEINPIFLANGIIKFVDLSYISFSNVKVSGIDLSYTNAHINPQEVYKKDMSNGKYCGLDFNLCNFKGVKVDNSDFTDAIIDFTLSTEEISKGIN